MASRKGVQKRNRVKTVRSLSYNIGYSTESTKLQQLKWKEKEDKEIISQQCWHQSQTRAHRDSFTT